MNKIDVTDLTLKELQPYVERSEKQLLRWNEPELGYFVAESPNVIMRALEAGYETVSFLGEEQQWKRSENQSIAEAYDVPIYSAKEGTMREIIGYELTRGMLCLMRRRPCTPPEDLWNHATRIVVLEDVMNPTNLGAIFRSAAALGMEAVLLTKGCVDPLYRRATRVSMGTVFQIPWTWVEDDWQEQLQQSGWRTVAMALRNDSVSLEDPILTEQGKLAIIMGTEGEGLKESTILGSNYCVKIPMSHGVDSLNVAAASAVAFWQLGHHNTNN